MPGSQSAGTELAGAQGADDAEGFADAAANINGARDRIEDDALAVEDEGGAQCDFFGLVEDAEGARNFATFVGEQEDKPRPPSSRAQRRWVSASSTLTPTMVVDSAAKTARAL